jgi:hypothetical protein
MKTPSPHTAVDIPLLPQPGKNPKYGTIWEILCFGFVYTAYVSVVLFFSRRFPAVNADEVVRAVIGLERWRGAPARYTLYDDIFDRSVYAMRDVIPDVLIACYHYWLGAWTLINPDSFSVARLSSLVAGLLAMATLYSLIRVWGGSKAALLGVTLLAFNPLFLFASFIARPETLFLFVQLLIISLTLRIPHSYNWKPMVVGALGALSIAVHPNAAITLPGILIIYLSRLSRRDRWCHGAYFGLGVFCGAMGVFIMNDPVRLLRGFHTVHSYLLRPPLLTGVWSPFEWARQTLSVLWGGNSFYWSGGRAGALAGQLFWSALALLTFVAIAVTSKEQKKQIVFPFLGAAGVTFVAMTFGVKAHESLYGIVFLPFLVPLVSLVFEPLKKNWARAARTLSVGMVLISLGVFGFAVTRAVGQNKPHGEIVRDLRDLVPEKSTKLAGPTILWFGWDKKSFRDLGALQISRWYNGGKSDMQQWLLEWQPDILVVDRAFFSFLKWPLTAPPERLPFLTIPHKFLGAVETGISHGPWRVYSLDWAPLISAPTNSTMEQRRETKPRDK